MKRQSKTEFQTFLLKNHKVYKLIAQLALSQPTNRLKTKYLFIQNKVEDA